MATRTWNGDGASDDWSDDDNWEENVAPVAGDDLIFANETRLTPNNDLTPDTSFASLSIAVSSDSFNVGGNRIRLAGPIDTADGSPQTFSLDIILDTQVVITADTGRILLTGDLSGTGGLDMEGGDDIHLGGNNTYSGPTNINDSRVECDSVGACSPNSAFVFANAASAILDLNSNNNTIGSLSGGGGTGGNIVLGTTGVLSIGDDDTDPPPYDGVILGLGGSIVKIGTGELILGGVNLYTGTTTVNDGVLFVNGSTSVSSLMIINSLGKLSGDGDVLDSVTVNTGGTIAPGDASEAILSIDGNLILNAGTFLKFGIGATSDLIDSVDGLTLNGTLNITEETGFGAGTFLIIKYSSTLVDNTLVVGTGIPVGFSAVINVDDDLKEVQLVVTADDNVHRQFYDRRRR